MGDCRIESKTEIEAYLARMRYALDNGAKIHIQMARRVDEHREYRYTNEHTIEELFPKEKPEDAIKRELKLLTVGNYMRTIKDVRFPNRSEMREFGKVYNGTDDVYIKIRVELLNMGVNGMHTIFLMSFHYAMIPFKQEMFPYCKEGHDADS